MKKFKEFHKQYDGVYISRKVSNMSFQKWVEDNIENNVGVHSLHTTVIFSDKKFNGDVILDTKVVKVEIDRYELFGPDENVLVGVLKDNDTLLTRNKHLMKEYNFISDYKYRPHITLALDYQGELPKMFPNVDIFLSNESIENLDKDWKA